MQSFLIMTKAVGDSGLNKIQVPLYWFPRNLWGLLSSWWKQYNRKLDICTIPLPYSPSTLQGISVQCPIFLCLRRGWGSLLVVQTCVTLLLLPLVSDKTAYKVLASRLGFPCSLASHLEWS